MIDLVMNQIDGTDNKSNLGANAIPTSLALLRACLRSADGSRR